MTRYKVIIQLTSGDVSIQKSAITHLYNILKAIDEIEIELVTHGKGIALLLNETIFEKSLVELNQKGVRFLVCQNALDAQKLDKTSVLDLAIIIPSAVAHLIIRQSEGWPYLRETF